MDEITSDTLTQTLWQSRPDSSQSWTNVSDAQPPPSVGISIGALHAPSDSHLYVLGGLQPDVEGSYLGLPSLVTQDLSSGSWTNESTIGYAGQTLSLTYTAWGNAIYVPNFGSDGILVFFSGYESQSRNIPWVGFAGGGATLQNMSFISIYDIGSKKFLQQQVRGPSPSARWAACAIGVEASAGEGFDMKVEVQIVQQQETSADTRQSFFHGGTPYGIHNVTFDADYSSVWALSLPAFQWTKVHDGSSTQMRLWHSCELAGNRYMLVLGGGNPNQDQFARSVDPNPNAIGIFDVASLEWTNSYDADASPYVRSSVLTSAIG